MYLKERGFNTSFYCSSIKWISHLVLQSAAMEETVIWEQHTVTLHRVSVYNVIIHSPLSSLSGLWSLFACLLHPKDAWGRVCSTIFPPCFFAHTFLFSPSAERASCSSRMCSTETIVKKSRWQETRLRKTKIQHPLPYYFISFPSCWQHTLLLNTTPGKEVHECFTPCAFVLCHM